MKDQLVSFETANLANQKGFSHTSQFGYIIPKGSKLGGLLLEMKGVVNVPYGSHIVFVPTQSLLQKWLYEEHHIWVEVIMCTDKYNNSNGNFQYGVTKIGQTPKYSTNIYNNPDEAWEVGLQETLNNINENRLFK